MFNVVLIEIERQKHMNKILKVVYRLVQIVAIPVWSFSLIMFVVSILSIIEYYFGYDFSFIEILPNGTNKLAKAHLFGSIDIKVNTVLTVLGVVQIWMFIFYYSYLLYLLLKVLKIKKDFGSLKRFYLYNLIPLIIGSIVVLYNLIINNVYKANSDIISFSVFHLIISVFGFIIYRKLNLDTKKHISI